MFPATSKGQSVCCIVLPTPAIVILVRTEQEITSL